VKTSSITRLAALVLLASGCASGPAAPRDGGTGPAPCTFANPLGPGQDPWVVRANDHYYLIESRDGGIYLYASETLPDIRKGTPTLIWTPPATGWNRSNIWAPELLFIDGKWYVYYAAGVAGPPFIHQRSGVLESAGADPMGPYTDRGMLHTGEDPSGGAIWAIDLTVQKLNGQLYAVWSGWEQNASTDKTPQQLYIARMSNPWTITGDRVMISEPVESWEVGTELSLNEGPEFLLHGEDVFIIYSTRESWLKEYRLGQLRLSRGADPMFRESWTKSGPVFAGTDRVYGTGHASFTKSPDGTEDWIVYHSKRTTQPGWDRIINAKEFHWKADGSPDFGTPPAPGEQIAVPSGGCQS
jgi:GH43 family beta-xylosidase